MTAFKWAGFAALAAVIGCGGGAGMTTAGAGGSGGTAGGGSGLTAGGAGSGLTAGAAGMSNSGGTAGPAGGAGGGGTAGTGGAPGAAGIGGTSAAAGQAGAASSGGIGGAGGRGHLGCQPDVLLVQDRSGSMANDENDNACSSSGCVTGTSKWSQMTAAVTQVVQSTDASVNWGVKFFPDDALCSASRPPAVPVGPMSGSAVALSLEATQPGGNTPTRDAILTATAYLVSLTDANPKFLVLATDGLPNCPVGCATTMCTKTDDAAVETAIEQAAQQGINTFVIGIGNVASAQSTLNQLAIAGGEAQAGAATSYYAATDGSAISAALMNIVDKVTGCPPPGADAGP